MIRLTIENSPYAFEVEFRHARAAGPRPALHPRHSTVAAITTCVIIALAEIMDGSQRVQFTAIGNAVCARGDNFSRRVGRWKAFVKAVRQCGMLHQHRIALHQHRIALLDAYNQADPDPLPREPHALTEAAKKERWEAGWEKRKAREDSAKQRKFSAPLRGTGSAS